MEPHFQELMKALFRHMKIELPRERENKVYVVGVDDQVKMKFFVAPAGYLNVISVIGVLPDAAGREFLLNVLNLNCFTPVYPQFTFKVGVDKKTREVELWLREPLTGLQPEKLIELFSCVVEMALFVKSWMEHPPAKEKAIQRTAHFLSGRGAATPSKPVPEKGKIS